MGKIINIELFWQIHASAVFKVAFSPSTMTCTWLAALLHGTVLLLVHSQCGSVDAPLMEKM